MCGEQKYQVYAYRVVFIGMSLSTGKNGLGSVNFFYRQLHDSWSWNVSSTVAELKMLP